VATPARAWQNIQSGSLSAEKLTHLVLDEADLVLSYGYEKDLENIAQALPKGVQAILTSATLTAELDSLTGTFCRDPTILDLQEKDAEGEGVTQFVVKYVPRDCFCLVKLLTGHIDAVKTKSSFLHMSSSSFSLSRARSSSLSATLTAAIVSSSSLSNSAFGGESPHMQVNRVSGVLLT
jgi:superfamily II DNA/RNA helicase